MVLFQFTAILCPTSKMAVRFSPTADSSLV
uniref:Uncharacterized protein n=1 Tax=Anguilla anguilla TaxID=7936 RepID=A0A0E9TVQ1_ANGAN